MIFKLSVQGGETGLKNDGKIIKVLSGYLHLYLLLPDLSPFVLDYPLCLCNLASIT